MQAITRPLSEFTDGSVDLNDVAGGDGTLFVRNGVGIAGRGVAARVSVDDAAAFLGDIDHDSTVPGCGPVAVGCVPFVPGSPADLLVPTVVFRKTADGTAAVTVVTDSRDIDDRSVAFATPRPRRRRAGRSARRSRWSATWPPSPRPGTRFERAD
jgi:hypothetical protein